MSFNGHPPLGVNATAYSLRFQEAVIKSFNGHPPLGVNATEYEPSPTVPPYEFQWAPTLGGECYRPSRMRTTRCGLLRFNGHPPLGVNATKLPDTLGEQDIALFQWAPTLGGECYIIAVGDTRVYKFPSFNGHPPLGVNATG